MKLVIDIPYNIYEWVRNTGKFGNYRFDTAKAIKNGTPLDEWQTEAFKNGWKEGFGMGKQDLAHKVMKLFEEEKV